MSLDILKDQFGCYPWIEDLFRDIKQKKMTVKKAAMMTGTRRLEKMKNDQDNMINQIKSIFSSPEPSRRHQHHQD